MGRVRGHLIELVKKVIFIAESLEKDRNQCQEEAVSLL